MTIRTTLGDVTESVCTRTRERFATLLHPLILWAWEQDQNAPSIYEEQDERVEEL